jgi:hypothetical protein
VVGLIVSEKVEIILTKFGKRATEFWDNLGTVLENGTS